MLRWTLPAGTSGIELRLNTGPTLPRREKPPTTNNKKNKKQNSAPVEFVVSAEETHPACKLNLSALGARERRARAAEPNRKACGN